MFIEEDMSSTKCHLICNYFAASASFFFTSIEELKRFIFPETGFFNHSLDLKVGKDKY